MALPDLSRFELQCLRRLWSLGEATVAELREALDESPSYSTVRKIIERLESKGAIVRARKNGQAWVYRPAVARSVMLRREIRRFLDVLFEGSAAPLVSHLADMKALTLEDLREIEVRLSPTCGKRSQDRSGNASKKRGQEDPA